MKSEIKIILEEGSSNKAQGTCFENLVRNLLAAHQYEITSNVNFTGMEIDLLAKHKIRKETLYVECKAKEKVSSTEIRTFAFNVNDKEVDHGYFIRTKELESQAAGLVEEMKQKDKYKNLTFIEPDKVIQILNESKFIQEPQIPHNLIITKRIFCVTYKGDYLLYIVTKDSVIPTHFLLFNAKSCSDIKEVDIISLIKDKIDEVAELDQLYSESSPKIVNNEKTLEYSSNEFETISEVQESEDWFDYLPASSEHFIGRDNTRSQIFDFFKNVVNNQTSRRIFYLTGKSGWGKSSLIAEIRGRCQNKHYKNKYYAYAVDTRSAISQNFVALSFKGMIKKATSEGFIKSDLFSNKLSFTSNQELLSSESVKDVLDFLRINNRVLILIFDQFEDVFRKPGLFKSFYKFLSDVTDSNSNLIVGFSWKTEILIPSENEAYHYWQQAKEQAVSFSIPEFGEKEIDGVIKQLENTVGKLNQELKRRIKESSQGLPWLTKKLCIHVYEQIKSGLKKDKLIDENLNIKELFESDKERIEGNELAALKYIAKKAYEGNFFDISEIGEQISGATIESLRDKRLIIRSGANYNIYWDIFRDYLVTNDIPPIGESYILRQGVNLCLEVFLLFKEINTKMSLDDLLEIHPRKIEKKTLENILIELRNVGLVQKLESGENYSIAKNDVEVSKEGFVKFITTKFQNYTPFLKLLRMSLRSITKEDITKILKETFKYEFKEKTWEIYSVTLIGWLQFSNADLKNKLINPQKGSRRLKQSSSLALDNYIIRSSKNELVGYVNIVKNRAKKKNHGALRDLFMIGLVNAEKHLTEKGKMIIDSDKDSDTEEILKELVLSLPKMKEFNKVYLKYGNISSKKYLELLPRDFLGDTKESSKLIYMSKILTWYK